MTGTSAPQLLLSRHVEKETLLDVTPSIYKIQVAYKQQPPAGMGHVEKSIHKNLQQTNKTTHADTWLWHW